MFIEVGVLAGLAAVWEIAGDQPATTEIAI